VITELHACPPTYPMSSRETLPLRFDLSALLAPGETPTAPAASLVRLDTGAAYPAGLSGTPVISDHYLTQSVTGLAAFITYRLSVRFQAAAGKIFDVLLDIPCRD
jgi:hypothetical protein